MAFSQCPIIKGTDFMFISLSEYVRALKMVVYNHWSSDFSLYPFVFFIFPVLNVFFFQVVVYGLSNSAFVSIHLKITLVRFFSDCWRTYSAL